MLIRQVLNENVLQKILSIPLDSWQFQGEEPGILHPQDLSVKPIQALLQHELMEHKALQEVAIPRFMELPTFYFLREGTKGLDRRLYDVVFNKKRSDLVYAAFLIVEDNGGQLLVDSPTGVVSPSPLPGDVFVFDSSQTWEVTPAESGVILAMGRIESQIANPAARNAIFRLRRRIRILENDLEKHDILDLRWVENFIKHEYSN